MFDFTLGLLCMFKNVYLWLRDLSQGYNGYPSKREDFVANIFYFIFDLVGNNKIQRVLF